LLPMDKEKIPQLTVVIPAKNEALSIGHIISLASKHASEIIVIDGSSEDDTAKIARENGAIVFTDSGSGKGDAVRLGIKNAHGEIIVFIDADGSHDARDIARLVEPMLKDASVDIVIASRGKGGSDELQGNIDKTMRLLGSVIINLAINIRWKQELTDAQNGYRAVRTEKIRLLDLREKITTIEQEMVIKALKKDFKIIEVPSHEYARTDGVSNIVLKKVWFRYVYSLIKYLF